MVGHDALSGPPVAQLPGAAGAGVVFDVLPDLAGVLAAGKPDATQSAPTASGYRCQGTRSRLGQTHTGPLRQLGIACRPWRLRNHHHRPACRYRTGAPDRSQPAAAGRWIGIRHGGRCGDRGVGCHPAVPAQRPRHDHAGAAGVEHTDVCGGQPVDPGRPAGQLGSGHPADYTGRRHPALPAGCGIG